LYLPAIIQAATAVKFLRFFKKGINEVLQRKQLLTA